MAVQLDEEDAVCLEDILEEDQELEDTANAVLGDSEDSKCSYSKGYVGRQALYSCATCSRGETAGVCLACSLHCHEGHDLYELYTKRHFRCDCGNRKFPGLTCTLNPGKEPLNTANEYGHNFEGLYCSCSRPYPDTEDEIEDEMIQCIVCEDWFHSRHLRTEVPPAYDEMSCDSCMQSHDFLHAYKLHTVSTQLAKEDEPIIEQHLEVDNSEEKTPENPSASCSMSDETKIGSNINGTTKAESGTGTEPSVGCELVRRQQAFAATSASSDKDVGRQQPEGREGGAGFFQRGWRLELCKCPSCMALYETHNCLFLVDESDSLAAYEQRASFRPRSHDAAVAALGSMSHIEQVEAIEHFNELKSELSDFLKSFAEKKRIVSKRDIDGFFEDMRERKRQKLDSQDGIPPANCHF